jgi:hypothetical protein
VAPATVAPVSVAAARAAVADVISSYARAIESRDVAAVRGVYPGLTPAQQKAWERFFKAARNLKALFTVEELDVSGAVAQARVRGTYEYQNATLHRPERAPVTFTALLTRDALGWRLAAVR